MENAKAFAMGLANQHKELMVFDWDKAARLIKEKKVNYAEAGLQGDWEYTGGKIFEDNKPVPKEDTYVYLASTWATPEIEINGELFDCYKMQSETPDWDSGTYWPDSALAIIQEAA